MRKLGGIGLAGVVTAALAAPSCGNSSSKKDSGGDAGADASSGTGGGAGTGGSAGAATGGSAGIPATGGGAGVGAAAGLGGSAGLGGVGGSAGAAGAGGVSGSAGVAGAAGAPVDAGPDASTMCMSGQFFNFMTGSCETCPTSDGPLMVVCSQFELVGTSFDPTTERITIDATNLGQIESGTFEVEYIYLDTTGFEVQTSVTGTITVTDQNIFIDLAGQLPAGTPRGLRVIVLDLLDVCGQTQSFAPLLSSGDMDAILFQPPPATDAGAGGSPADGGMDAIAPDGGSQWVVGCVFEGML